MAEGKKDPFRNHSEERPEETIDMEEVDGVWQEVAPEHEGRGRRSDEDLGPDLRPMVITWAAYLAIFAAMAAWQVLGGRLVVGLAVLVVLSIAFYLLALKTLELVVRIWNLWKKK